MVSKLVLAYLTVFLAAGVSYALHGTAAFGAAAAGLKGLHPGFLTRIIRTLEVDNGKFLASRYPNVPSEQRANLGVIPETLAPLIQGADKTGRLLIPAPQPGHALLLTKNVPEYTSSLGPAFIQRATRTGDLVFVKAKSWTASKNTVKGIGAITDSEGKVHYFHTIPFNPPRPGLHPKMRVATSPNHVTPQSLSKSKKFFGSHPITLKLPSGELHHSKDKVFLSHISLVPNTGPHELELKVYPPEILDQVLKGPPQEMVQRSKGWSRPLVEWSETPNWSRKERKAAKMMEAKPSSPRWFQKLKAPFSRSNPDSRSLRGSDEGLSNSGSSPSGALVRSA
ncbi:hypothetical protein NDA12_004348 [Ustilago hordei]|nr:hypothetical protein NDA15_004927 [Ustilago hordei]KAJ1571820.1 hypothetical protein NDA12_004348 [Ustilago hordei]